MQDDIELRHAELQLPGLESSTCASEGLHETNSKEWVDEGCTKPCENYLNEAGAAFVLASPDGVCNGFSKRRFLKAFIQSVMKGGFDESLMENCEFLLVQMINAEDQATQLLGCVLISKLGNFISELGSIKDAFPALIRLLNIVSTSFGMSVQEASLLAVKKIARRGASARLMLGNAGAISSLLSLVSQNDEKLQILALEALKELILSDDCNQERFTQAGGIRVVLDVVNSTCERIRCLSGEMVGIVARWKNVRREIANRAGVSSLIEAVRMGSMASRSRAAHALGLLAFVKRARRLIVDNGGLPALICLLRDGDETARIIAGNSLGIVAACVDHLWEVAQAGAIPLYIELLEGGNPHGKDIAEDVFCILAVSEENAFLIIEHLVRILCEGTVESKAAAADVIWDLSSYRHSTSFVIASGAIPVLVELLKHENEELRENVSGAIAQLAYNDNDRQALAEAGVIPILVELLQDQSTEVKGNVAEALNSFGEDPIYRSYLVDTACTRPPLGILQRMAGGGYEDSDLF